MRLSARVVDATNAHQGVIEPLIDKEIIVFGTIASGLPSGENDSLYELQPPCLSESIRGKIEVGRHDPRASQLADCLAHRLEGPQVPSGRTL